jgi:hypothetical protein
MPLMKCKSEGKSGWKYGNSGHCYPGGKEAKKKAIKQGLAESYRSGEKFDAGKGSVALATASIHANTILASEEEKGRDVQAVYFAKDKFSQASMVNWAENFNFLTSLLDAEDDERYIKAEQHSLDDYKAESLEVMNLMDGIIVVTGIPTI